MERIQRAKDITVTNDNIQTADGKGTEIKFKTRYVKYDNSAEFVQHAGDEKVATDFVNGAVEESMDRYVRTRLRTAPKGTDIPVLLTELESFCENWTPSMETQQASKADLQARLSQLEAKILSGSATQEDLLALIRGKQAA